EPPIKSCVEGAIHWAVVASNRPTSLFATYGSSVRVPGGMRSTATRCWHCAVPSITAPSIRCLRVINSVYGKRKNHRMLPIEQLLPKSIHAVTPQGFELKVALFVIASSLNCYLDL